jgi:hypothetical protein
MDKIFVKLEGGLGNLLFKISAGYFLSKSNNCELICDSSIKGSLHGKYSKYNNNILRNVKIENINEPYSVFTEKSFNYSKLPDVNQNIYLDGYYQSEKYFKEFRQDIFDLFKADEGSKNLINKKYSNIISGNTCSIHVRRNDYLRSQDSLVVLPIDYYKKSVEYMGDDLTYLIFSDDIKWCEENFNFIKNKIFITGNEDYIDLYLMSMCKNNITANSTFSWWAAWMNENKNKKVICPNLWFGPRLQHYITSDLYCENWIKL